MKRTTHLRVPVEFDDTITKISKIQGFKKIDVLRNLNKELNFRLSFNNVGSVIFGWKKIK